MPEITYVSGREILDSRGRPTVEAAVGLDGAAPVWASVPSGASTGGAEAVDLRDGDAGRFGGLGCLRAASHIRNEIAQALIGRSIGVQEELDACLVGLDGTSSKRRLGANALLAVSLAFARAAAVAQQQPLYEYFHGCAPGAAATGAPELPRLTVNLFSGGLHAGRQVAIQDVLVVPVRAASIADSLAVTFAVYQAAARLIRGRYGMRPLTADEGGLAPAFENSEAMLAAAVEAIQLAGFVPGQDVALAVDVAATHFYDAPRRGYALDGKLLTAGEIIDVLLGWVERYPIWSVEDPLAEEDWEHWPVFAERAGHGLLVVGDDLLCTQVARIERALAARAAGALLLKVNQVGTVSEAARALALARRAGWRVIVSARSGETEDHWLADLAVGWRGDQIKVGSITHSERLAKYNRLLAIEAEIGWPLRAWPARPPQACA
jgi:enolase